MSLYHSDFIPQFWCHSSHSIVVPAIPLSFYHSDIIPSFWCHSSHSIVILSQSSHSILIPSFCHLVIRIILWSFNHSYIICPHSTVILSLLHHLISFCSHSNHSFVIRVILQSFHHSYIIRPHSIVIASLLHHLTSFCSHSIIPTSLGICPSSFLCHSIILTPFHQSTVIPSFLRHSTSFWPHSLRSP